MTVERTELAKKTPASKKAGVSKIPAGAKIPDDHRSAKDEVEGGQVITVKWLGVEYDVDATSENMDDLVLIRHFNSGNFVAAMEILIGAAGVDKYIANAVPNARGKVSLEDAGEFFAHVMAEIKAKNS